MAAGYDGLRNAVVTYQLASGVTIAGIADLQGNGGTGIDTGFWPSSGFNVTLALQVSGKVRGGGGAGGTGSDTTVYVAGTGGHAIFCRENIAITVNSGGEVREAVAAAASVGK